MTDTPPTSHPASRIDIVKGFIGDLARPFAIIATSFGATWASIVVAYRVEDGTDAALLMTAIFAGVGAIYGFKAWEVAKTGKQSAEVEIAKANTDTSRTP